MKNQRRYEAWEIHGLTEEEFAEMRSLCLSREEWDSMHANQAHGHLCAALIHLREAAHWFCRVDQEKGNQVNRLADSLAPMIPSYLDRKTTKGAQ